MIYKDRKQSSIEKKAKKTTGKIFTSKDIDPTILKTISYEYSGRDVLVELTTDEFTCVCPFSGLPDFANLTITYTPSKLLIELKSLKMYTIFFRNTGIFHEHLVNKFLEDFVRACKPRRAKITGVFNPRGGITTTVTREYRGR